MIDGLIPFVLLAAMAAMCVWCVIITITAFKRDRLFVKLACVFGAVFAFLIFVDCIGMFVTQSPFGWFR